MFILEGAYNKANVYTDNINNKAISQIINILNKEEFKKSNIAIMPDVHPGANCVVGLTMTIDDSACVNLVGGDIGCGVSVFKINKKEKDIDFKKLDSIIGDYISKGEYFYSGIKNTIMNKENKTLKNKYLKNIEFEKMKCFKSLSMKKIEETFLTLGSGNHFIEIDKSENGDLFFVIHTGSRNLGKQVAKYYQKLANIEIYNNIVKDIVEKYKRLNKQNKIDKALKNIKIPDNPLACVTKDNFKNYLEDIEIVQNFAKLNRFAIVKEISKKMNFEITETIESVHNYIDVESKILRKGAISAKKNEPVVIPLNMKDGCIIGYGKGIKEWNYSANHGAGRNLSRSEAKELIDFKSVKNLMEGVWSSTISEKTVDESPFSYKDKDEIIGNIKETVDIRTIIKPIYVIKSN